MPKRNSTINKEQATTIRRSPRLQHHKNPQEPEYSKNPKPKPRNNRVHPSPISNSETPYSDPLLSSTPNASLKKTHKDANKSNKSNDGSKNCVKMPKRNSIINNERASTLRRSPRLRLQHHKNPQEPDDSKNPKRKPRNSRVHSSPISNSETPYSDPLLSSTPNASLKKTHKDYPEKDAKKSNKSNDGSKNCAKLITGSRKSSRLNNGVEGFSCLRRSPRVSNRRNADKHIDKMGDDKSNLFPGKEVLLDVGNAKVGADSCEQFVGKREGMLRSSPVGSATVITEGGERKPRDVEKRIKEIGVKRKRKRGEEGDGQVQGWTKEQEVALQRAYIAAKPTPHFWKKVAKLVPGKSAQDCFDRVHSDHLTPPQPRPRSRANRTNLSSMGYFSLSASKLLKPTEPKIKRASCNKQKSHLAQKTVRHLLQKHYNVDKDYEADLFSVLEPTMNPSTQASQQSVILSTPEHVTESRGEGSSGHKKPLSRFIISCRTGTALVSPPVLKHVKNRALHEKYIDQLHLREAKRKAASAKNEDRKESHVQKLDVLRAAKNALVSDARDAINQFRHLQTNPTSNSSDFDDNGVDIDDDDDDDGL